jgi:hypothetical protein
LSDIVTAHQLCGFRTTQRRRSELPCPYSLLCCALTGARETADEDLKILCEKLGFADVRTYIASGNAF